MIATVVQLAQQRQALATLRADIVVSQPLRP
jgi:hypothetical protein